MSGEITNIEKNEGIKEQATKQPQLQNCEKELTQTLQTNENNGLAPGIHKIDARLQYNTIHNIEKVQNIGGKLTFIVGKRNQEDFTLNYSVMWGNEELGEFSYINYLKNIGEKPAFIAKKKDGDYTIMRGHDELITIEKNEALGYLSSYISDGDKLLKNIGGKPAFAVGKQDGNYVVMRGTEKLGEFKGFISSYQLKNIGEKPAFIVEENGNYIVMRGTEKLGEFKKVINNYIAYMGGKPVFLAEKENGDEVVMQGSEELAAEHMPNSCCHPMRFDKIFELQGKPIFLVYKNDHRQIIMRGSEELGEIINKEKLEHVDRIYTVKGGKNICKIFGENELKEPNEFSFLKRGPLSGGTIYIIKRNGENYAIFQPDDTRHQY